MTLQSAFYVPDAILSTSFIIIYLICTIIYEGSNITTTIMDKKNKGKKYVLSCGGTGFESYKVTSVSVHVFNHKPCGFSITVTASPCQNQNKNIFRKF